MSEYLNRLISESILKVKEVLFIFYAYGGSKSAFILEKFLLIESFSNKFITTVEFMNN